MPSSAHRRTGDIDAVGEGPHIGPWLPEAEGLHPKGGGGTAIGSRDPVWHGGLSCLRAPEAPSPPGPHRALGMAFSEHQSLRRLRHHIPYCSVVGHFAKHMRMQQDPCRAPRLPPGREAARGEHRDFLRRQSRSIPRSKARAVFIRSANTPPRRSCHASQPRRGRTPERASGQRSFPLSEMIRQRR